MFYWDDNWVISLFVKVESTQQGVDCRFRDNQASPATRPWLVVRIVDQILA
jgi:hypothetical protein